MLPAVAYAVHRIQRAADICWKHVDSRRLRAVNTVKNNAKRVYEEMLEGGCLEWYNLLGTPRQTQC